VLADEDGDKLPVPAAQLQQPRVGEFVASILRSRIVNGDLPDGSRLPKQDELLREFRVSRASLREALRILQTEGLVTVQRGNVGGAIVQAPRTETSAYIFGLVLQSHHVRVSDLAEALRNVEPVAAALCARRDDRRETVVAKLRDCMQQGEAAVTDGVEYTRSARRFHEEVVRGCGNQTLILMLGTLELMWSHHSQSWAQRANEKGFYTEPAVVCEESLTVHAAILDAIEEGDADRAASLARSHLADVQQYPLSDDGYKVVEVSRPRRSVI
jgi:DNA-binding FadR family transcriptional regulator